MPYAVVVYFDETSEQPILHVWNELIERQYSQKMLSAGIRPHMTLSIYDDFDCAECELKIINIARNLELFNIRFDHLGIFPFPSPVIFIAPTANLKLIDFQKKIHDALSPHVKGSWGIYEPDHWVPHCTLAQKLDRENFSTALEICLHIQLPLCMKISKIGVVFFEPIQPLFEIGF